MAARAAKPSGSAPISLARCRSISRSAKPRTRAARSPCRSRIRPTRRPSATSPPRSGRKSRANPPPAARRRASSSSNSRAVAIATGSLGAEDRDKEGPSRQNGGMYSPRPLPARIVPPLVPRLIAARLPVFYGWIVLACLCCAGFARQGPAVATLSIFVEPLTREFGWSRTALSGAVSLGGVLAALVAPLVGPVLDRQGSRLVLCAAVLVNGIALMLLSLTGSLGVFYLLFCLARMNWAAPFDLGLYGALNNWFVRRRGFASSVATLAQQIGLVAMPLIAQLAILEDGWRAGWLAIGATTLVVGFVPTWLLLVRRPEDLGLSPDGAVAPRDGEAGPLPGPIAVAEAAFSRRRAPRTGALWLLLLYTVLVFPVQAGVSLHQAPYLIERGIDPTIAATIVSTFSAMSAVATVACA